MNEHSPITGQPCSITPSDRSGTKQVEEDIGYWYMSDEAHYTWLKSGGDRRALGFSANPKEFGQMLALARTLVWRTTQFGGKPICFLSGDHPRAPGEIDLHFQIVTPEALHQAAQRLTFAEKSAVTLDNLISLENSVGEGVPLRASFGEHVTALTGAQVGSYRPLTGIAHAAVDSEIPMILQYLIDGGLLRPGVSAGSGTTLHITPHGYAASGSRNQPKGPRKAFLICRFTAPMDQTFDSLYAKVGDHEELRCPIQRVKDVHHIDRIDDKILQMIDEATVVVVDLTDNNFNVAFEAGYALARGKPIVWTMSKSMIGDELKLPFDIQSHNIKLYDPADLDGFRENLVFSLRAAIVRAEGKE